MTITETYMTESDKKRRGYIYCIRSFCSENIYIGSTFQPLHKRLYEHRMTYKRCRENKTRYVSSFDILCYEDHYIELLQELESVSRYELNRIEGEYIRKNKCVNKIIQGRTDEEYRRDNKEILNTKQREKYALDRDAINEKKKLYYNEKGKELKKNYYLQKKELITARTTEKVECVCGKSISRGNLAIHKKRCKV